MKNLITIFLSVLIVSSNYIFANQHLRNSAFRELLNSDGTINLNKDFCLNNSNYEMILDENNVPMFKENNQMAVSSSSQGTWNSVGTGSSNGVSGTASGVCVTALAVFNGELYVGGHFSNAGGIPANNIAKWNGTTWSTVGSGSQNGVNGDVWAFTIFNNELIVGGSFTMAGSIQAYKVASWDGTDWHSLGTGLGTSGVVYSLCVYNSELYAGGSLAQAGSLSIKNIARWDGTNWNSLGSGSNNGVSGSSTNQVLALIVYNGDLYVGGQFNQAGSISAVNLARWNGTDWFSFIGSSPNNTVESFAIYNGELYMAGNFTQVGGIIAGGKNYLVKWNNTNSTWEKLLGGTNGSIIDIAVYNNKLYACGGFTQANNMSSKMITSWDGSAYDSLGSGILASMVYALAEFNGELYVGGCMSQAGGIAVNKIARWSAPVATYINENFIDKSFNLFPNPNRGNFTIQASAGMKFELMDYTGKIINTYQVLQDRITIQEELSSGLYLIRNIESGAVQKLIIQN